MTVDPDPTLTRQQRQIYEGTNEMQLLTIGRELAKARSVR